jgi:hypothetical protein
LALTTPAWKRRSSCRGLRFIVPQLRNFLSAATFW